MTKYDLTEGKPLKRILLFTLPLLIGNLFQQLYSMVDTVIVGRTISAAALAGVGATASLTVLVIGFAQGLTIGFSVLTSQFCGAKKQEEMRRSVAVSYKLCLYFSVVITVAAVLSAMPLLQLMQTPVTIRDYSRAYITTIFWGLSATIFYNMVSAQLRAVGDARTPLYFLIVAALLNVGLDFLFIQGFQMGVAGAGWATVISQALAGAGSFIVLLRKFPELRPRWRDLRWDLRFSWRLIALGLPMALQTSVIAVGSIAVQTAFNRLGDLAVSVHTIGGKIDNLAVQGMTAVGGALAPYCGQNYGAGRFDNIRTGMRQSLLLCCGYALLCLGMVPLAKPLTYLFISAEEITPELIRRIRQFVLTQTAFFIPLAAICCCRNAMQGMGRSVSCMIGGGIELGMRIITCLVLAEAFGFNGVCFSSPLAWTGAGAYCLVSYLRLIRKKLK